MSIEELENDVSDRLTRNVLAAYSVISLYVMAVATSYYNYVSDEYNYVYHLMSQIFGNSIYTTALYIYVGSRIGMPRYANIAAVGLFTYTVINLALASVKVSMPEFDVAVIFPLMETFSNLAFASLCTLSMFPVYGKLHDFIFKRRW